MKRKITEYLTKRKYVILLVFTILCAGMVAGVFSAVEFKNSPEIAVNQLSGKDIIISSFSQNVAFLCKIALWGTNLFGFPAILCLLWQKGASISAAICAMTVWDNSSGILFALSVLPYLACTIASVMILSQGSLNCSLKLFKSVFDKRNNKNISQILASFIAEFAFSTLIAFLGGVCETILKVNIV